MKIILARPAYSPLYELITSKITFKEVTTPLGQLYVAAALEKDGHQIEIIDGEADNLTPDEIFHRIEQSKPDIVGVGATTVDFHYAEHILREVKEKFNIITILGGPHATVLPDQVLDKNPHIDYLIREEGEITAPELVKQLARNGDISLVKGISYRQNGKNVHNADQPLIEDLNKNVLPARHLIDPAKYLSILPGKGMKRWTLVQTIRGCPFKCIYCYRMFGKGVRFRDPELVVDEIEDCLSNYGVEYIMFVDDTFTINQKRAIAICEEIIKRKLVFAWRCFTRANVINEEVLRIMKEAGCKHISMGVESGNQEILDKACKGIKLEEYIEAYKLFEKMGFEKRGSFILGLPYENAKTIQDTINFAKKLRLDRAFFNICTPYPETQLYDMAKKGEGLCLTTDSWEEFRRWGNAVIELDGISREDLIEWQKIAMMEFYTSPRVIWHHIKEFIKGDHTKFYYRPFLFGLKEFYRRKIKGLFKKPF